MKKESKRTSETPQSTWLGGAQGGSLWLCYAEPWLRNGKVRSQVGGIDRSRFPGRRTVRKVRRGGRRRRRASDKAKERDQSAPINSRLNVVVRSPAPFGLGRNGCWPSRGSQLPRALPFIQKVGIRDCRKWIAGAAYTVWPVHLLRHNPQEIRESYQLKNIREKEILPKVPEKRKK